MISPRVKKAKKSEETGCDNTKDSRISSGGEDEKLEIPVGGEEAIAAVVNGAAEEGGFSCISEEKKGFVFEADVAEDKGARHAMEDVSVVLPDASLDFPGKLRCAHFSIYDGHGGRLAAEFAKKHLHLNVLSAGLPRLLWCHSLSFRKTDELLLQESVSRGWQDGATAVCVWIVDQKVFIANIGDAKAVLARSSPADESGNHNTEACNQLKTSEVISVQGVIFFLRDL